MLASNTPARGDWVYVTSRSATKLVGLVQRVVERPTWSVCVLEGGHRLYLNEVRLATQSEIAAAQLDREDPL